MDICAFPRETNHPIRRLMQFHSTYRGEASAGLLAFDFSLSAGKTIRPGASGGIVVDSKTQQIMDVLSAIAMNRDATALAVPIQSLVDFVSKTEPYLAQDIYPSIKTISPVSADIYPKLLTPPVADSLQRRPEESAEVKLLRGKSQLLADSMRNLIAVQTFAWGAGNKVPAAVSEYEVRVLDGYQRFRKFPNGKKEWKDVPFPPLNTADGSRWGVVRAAADGGNGTPIENTSSRRCGHQRKTNENVSVPGRS